MSSPLPIVEKALTIDQQVGCANAKTAKSNKIWIDFDNSPHIPFFLPIIGELKSRGYHVLLTARNAYQVCELVEFFRLQSEVLGGHWCSPCRSNHLGKRVSGLERFGTFLT